MHEGCGQQRILVVDDHPHGAQIVGKLLAQEGFDAILAFSGEEALSRLAEEDFAAVISDVEMPDMNGFELLQNIHLRWPHLPVLLMSLFVKAKLRESALAWGAAALLEKPFSQAQVKAALTAALSVHAQEPGLGSRDRYRSGSSPSFQREPVQHTKGILSHEQEETDEDSSLEPERAPSQIGRGSGKLQ